VIKTTIFSQGEIVQQVTQNYLLYPELLAAITKLHYLLIEELLLSKPKPKSFKKIFLIIIVMIIVIIGILLFYIGR